MSIVKRNQERALKAKLGEQGKVQEQKPVSQQQVVSVIEKQPEHQQVDTNKELEFYGVAIDADKAQLKKFSTIEEKDEYKATALENTDYLDFVAQYLKSGSHYPNRVFAWVMVWLVDLGRWQQALNYLPILVKQQQPLPTQFNTKAWTDFFIDQLYDAGNRVLQAQQEEPNAIIKSDILKVFTALVLYIEHEKPLVNDIVLGKLYAMAAKLEFEMYNFGNALVYSEKATQVNDKAGVKGLTKKVVAVIGSIAPSKNQKEKE